MVGELEGKGAGEVGGLTEEEAVAEAVRGQVAGDALEFGEQPVTQLALILRPSFGEDPGWNRIGRRGGGGGEAEAKGQRPGSDGVWAAGRPARGGAIGKHADCGGWRPGAAGR